ncbi:MAG: BMP family ABC transporter substrate-binding protein [Planctomycetes bacterium]|nr:BMP family ABC transporter substrate-binding protein [Planctomycetota bacterium]
MRSVAMGLIVLLAGSQAQPQDKPVKAGIVFDVGGLGDKSFNDAAYRGLMRAKEQLHSVGEYYEPKEPADRESGLRRFAGDRFDLIVGVGFMFTDDLLALADDFPQIRWACVDMTIKTGRDGKTRPLPKNLVGLKFREEEGSFLVGALAGLVTKTNTIGFVGGMNVPLIHKFEAGFAAGARHVNPKIEVLVGYAGETPEAFKDAAKGKSLALGMYERGADIIYHASGQTGRGVFEAAKEKNKLAIGVDSDQYEEAPGNVLTSMIKRVDGVVYDTIKAVREGRFEPGYKIFGLKEDGVGFVYDERNKSLIPADVYEKVVSLRQEIVDGRIRVPDGR